MGTVGLQPVRANRVMVVIEKHKESQIYEWTINVVSAARSALGLECPLVVEMDPAIKMRENHNLMRNELERLGFKKGKYFVAANYPEAVGIMTALKAGVALGSVRRPLSETKVVCERTQERVTAETEVEAR